MSALTKLWTWLADPENRSRLAFIGGGVAAVAVAGWQVYLHISFPVPPPPLPPVVSAPVDPAAIERVRKSQEKALGAEACALDNITRQISGDPPVPCPAPGSNR
jgi:hypothetical protein